jgi:N-acetylglutamate synthase/N-acetylornithine aminotransferase
VAAEFSENGLKNMLESPECVIRLVLRGGGKGESCFWTCDLTEGYIRINASYRT